MNSYFLAHAIFLFTIKEQFLHLFCVSNELCGALEYRSLKCLDIVATWQECSNKFNCATIFNTHYFDWFLSCTACCVFFRTYHLNESMFVEILLKYRLPWEQNGYYSLNRWKNAMSFFKIRLHFSVSGATLNSYYILCSVKWFECGDCMLFFVRKRCTFSSPYSSQTTCMFKLSSQNFQANNPHVQAKESACSSQRVHKYEWMEIKMGFFLFIVH